MIRSVFPGSNSNNGFRLIIASEAPCNTRNKGCKIWNVPCLDPLAGNKRYFWAAYDAQLWNEL